MGMSAFSREEMEGRVRNLRSRVSELNIDCVLATSYTCFYYISGAPIHPYGRPMAALIPMDGQSAIIESVLEEEHTRLQSWITDIRTYYDYNFNASYEDPRPPLESLMQLIRSVLAEKHLTRGRIGIEENALTLRQHRILESALPEATLVDVSDVLDRLRMVKSQDELRLIRSADKIADVGQECMIRHIRPGTSAYELTTLVRAAMTEEIGKRHPDMPFHMRIICGLGSAAKSSGHSEWTTWNLDDRIVPGQLLETVVWAWLWGYMGNVERAVFVGEPSDEIRRCFACMIEANEAAIAAIRPGIPLAEVDRAAKKSLAKHGFETPTGSGVGRGIISHEGNARELAMDVRLYSDVILEPGMVFSIEPDLRSPGIGTFRHSNTIIVTDTGCEVDSSIPRGMICV